MNICGDYAQWHTIQPRKGNHVICNNKDKLGEHCVQCSKPETQTQTWPELTHM
jgi:hypothetical protein